MKGHLRERSPGHWAIVIDVRDSATGKRKRRWHSFAGSKRQAQIECAQLITKLQSGTQVDPTRITVAEFFERWLDHMRGRCSPRTHERYTELCRKNLVPLLGGHPLAKLQPATISQAYAKALSSGRRDGQGGLSPRTVHHMHRVLRQCLQQGVEWQVLSRNPAGLVRPPKVERRQMQTLDADGTIELIEAARTTSLFLPILLGVLCGLRRGEVVALRWRSVDLKQGQLAVSASTEQTDAGIREKDTKSGNSRSVALPAMVVEELRQHRLRQAERHLLLGVRLSEDHHVVTSEDGRPLQPRSLSQAFRKFLARNGLKKIRLHDLRHSHATAMLAAGVHPKIAQERLGHSSVSVTIDLYSHILPGMQAEAVSLVDAAMKDALDRRAAKKKW
jgi:integrase